MEGQDDAVELETTPEQDAAADAAFEAAFNNARGDTPNAEGTLEHGANGQPLVKEVETGQDDASKKAASDEAEAQAAAQAQAAAEAEENAPATVTKSELAALRAVAGQVTALQDELKRTSDATAGRIGSLYQTLDTVKAQAKQGIKPTLNQLKRLSGEFPELAILLTQDLEEAFGTGNATQVAEAGHQEDTEGKASGEAPGAAPVVDPFADPRVQKTLREKEMAIVDEAHPDWRDLNATPEFNEWRSALPQAAQQLLSSTWDSKVMKDAFTDFKSWNSKRTAAADANKQRGKRLENAVPATTGATSGANAVDEDAAFLSGFKKASGRGR